MRPAQKAVLCTVLAVVAGAPLGLRPPQLWSGLRWGAAAAGAVSVGVTATTAMSRVRIAMGARELPPGAARWLTYQIPVGTVWSEEMVFRGALGTAAAHAFGPTAGRLVQATAFGLFHIPNARAAQEPILGTVLVTGVAGWIFAVLAERSGSLLAPMLAHLAINEAGAVATLVVQRRSGSTVL